MTRGRFPTWAWLFLLWSCLTPVLLAADSPRAGEAYGGPPGETIQTEVGRILSEPRFAPRTTFWQWLAKKLSAWEKPSVNPGVKKVVLWILVIWCVLALLAILCHLAWFLIRSLPGRGTRTTRGRRHFERLTPVTYGELHGRMERLAGRGMFRAAIRVMMVALVRWLDDASLLRSHQSKTNGDYVREYPREHAGYDLFRQFVLAFDVLIYGRADCGRADYQKMCAAFQRIQNRVHQR